jgi:hypothetical protein
LKDAVSFARFLNQRWYVIVFNKDMHKVKKTKMVFIDMHSLHCKETVVYDFDHVVNVSHVCDNWFFFYVIPQDGPIAPLFFELMTNQKLFYRNPDFDASNFQFAIGHNKILLSWVDYYDNFHSDRIFALKNCNETNQF